jgi:hypothetical protein
LIRRPRTASFGTRPPRHCFARAANSISATFSHDPCLGGIDHLQALHQTPHLGRLEGLV